MGAKKKGLANKLAKMSDEERARYLQQRADIEEEARRRKEQLIATFMKNKLKKEDGFLRLNLSKINQYWHQILRKVKCNEMRDELEHTKRWIERAVALKNRTIENLIQELEDAEEQYANNLQAHLSHIDRMLDDHWDYISTISGTYEEDRNRLLATFAEDREALNADATTEETYLKTIICGQNGKSLELGKKAQTRYDDDRIEELTSFKLSMGKLRKEREDILCEIWKQIAHVIRLHVDNVDKRRSHMAELKRLDAESSAEILKNQDRINREEQSLAKLKADYETSKMATGEELQHLRGDVDRLTRRFADVRNRLQKDLATDERKLLMMTDASNAAIAHLQALDERGTQILTLAQTCGKYETEADSLVPYLPQIAIATDRTEKSEIETSDRRQHPRTVTAPSTSSASSTDTSSVSVTSLPPPAGYVKYKIKRPRTTTTTYDDRVQRRLQKALKQATDDGDESDRTSKSSLTLTRSRLTARKFGTSDRADSATRFAIDHPFLACYDRLKDLDRFWTRYNNVALNVADLRAEKCRLSQENRHLRGTLRALFEAVAMDRSGVCSRIPTRVCSRYEATKSAPTRRRSKA